MRSSFPGISFLIRYDRNRHGGGVAIYILDMFPFSVIAIGPNSLKFISISINHPSTKIGLAVLYRPPSSSCSFFDSLFSTFEALNIPMYSNYLLFGDLNTDISTNNSLHTQLCSVTDQFSLTIIPTGHTRVTDSSETTTDVALTTKLNPVCTNNCSTVPPLDQVTT